MAHMIDESNAQANIAYVGETPWHSLGQRKLPGMSIESWRKDAGLAHEVRRAAVEFHHEGELRMFATRQVLFRSDTLAPLSVVGKDYKIVQPSQVLDFFEKLVEHNGFDLETAGSLDGGKRIWALAKVSDGAPVIGQDVVKPYVLLATSYDTSMATTARFTSVRVVCHNTLSMADAQSAKAGTVIRVPHTEDFDAKAVRLDLGIAFDAFERFMVEAKVLAKKQVNERFAIEFLKQLLPTPIHTVKLADGSRKVEPRPIEESKAFQSIMALFKGEAMGSGLPEAQGTAWQLLNAITQHTDWNSGRNANGRIASAWFGNGSALKDTARNTLLEVCQ